MDSEEMKQTLAQMTQIEHTSRQDTMKDIAQRRLELKQGVARMEVARWLQRVAVHISRIDLHRRELNYQQ